MTTQTVLITGASFGIGEALAGLFARHGHDLVLVARSAGKLRTLARELGNAHGVRVSSIGADLSVPGAAAKLAATLRRRRARVDILVNNAGVLEHGAFCDTAPAGHQRMVQLNVAGLTDMLAQFVPPMRDRGHGRVLNVASIAAFQPFASLATYAATKAYVLSLSEALGEELRGTGVTVTALCPGITRTNMVSAVSENNARLAELPPLLLSDVGEVAEAAYRACMQGVPIVVPGTFNQFGTLLSRATPKWLVRRIGGVLGRASLDTGAAG